MKTTTIDRFSSPLATEWGKPDLSEWIAEQNELNKRNIVDEYISRYWSEHQELPEAENIQEAIYHLDMDLEMINQRLEVF